MNDLQVNADPVGDVEQRSLRISTGARLHFGLLDVAPPFGGLGVMIDRPATEIVVTPADSFNCTESLANRIGAIAGRVAQEGGLGDLPNCNVEVIQRPRAHSGLGSGTQLSLACAEALCRFVSYHCDQTMLAMQIARRGQRSAVGIHGYFRGGLIYECAADDCPLNPICRRVELPDPWCVLLFRPDCVDEAVSGEVESDQFAKLAAGRNRRARDELSQIASERLLPAVTAADFGSFAASVRDYNFQSGMLFEPIQGGPYNGPAVARLVDQLDSLGAQGIGQSSWGPTVFSWFESAIEAEQFIEQMPAEIPAPTLAHAKSSGRMIDQADGASRA